MSVEKILLLVLLVLAIIVCLVYLHAHLAVQAH